MFKSFIEAFKNLGLYFVLSIALELILVFFGITDGTMMEILLILGNMSIAYILYKILKDKFKGQIEDFKKNYKSYLKIGFKCWFLGYALMILSNLLIISVLGDIAPNESANRDILTEHVFYAICTMIIITPFVEEMLFRLNFKDCFKKKWSFVIATGFIFASLHVVLSLTGLEDLLYIIPYFALGSAFSYMYYETKNIFTSTLMHSMHNLLAVLVILFGI